MGYKLRYRIRDWFFKLLFPTIAMHEAHLVDDCITLALKARELQDKEAVSLNGFTTRIVATSNDKTIYADFPSLQQQ